MKERRSKIKICGLEFPYPANNYDVRLTSEEVEYVEDNLPAKHIIESYSVKETDDGGKMVERVAASDLRKIETVITRRRLFERSVDLGKKEAYRIVESLGIADDVLGKLHDQLFPSETTEEI